MKKILILLGFTVLVLSSCKKDSAVESVTVKYDVGDKFIYIMESSYFYDDTTTANLDSASLQYDTVITEIIKDTVINNYLCKVVSNEGWLGLNRLEYVTFLEDGYYNVASKSRDFDELNVYNPPIFQFPSNMSMGTHWGESPDGKNRRYEVVSQPGVTNQTATYNCVKVKYNIFPEDSFFNPDDVIYQYISSKGLVKMEFSGTSKTNDNGLHGKVYWSLKMNRIN